MSRIDPYKLKISQLRALAEVATQGNFSLAALQLDLSQSTVSHAIAMLEEELGVVLLNRGRNGAKLTPIGERVVSQARQVLHLLEGIAAEANREKGLQGGQVRIGTMRSVATHILPSVIAQFHHHFPEVTVTIIEYDDTPEMEQALRSRIVDLSFVYLPACEDFDTKEILRDDYIALLPPRPKIQDVQLSWEQLATYSLIMSSTSCCAKLIYGFLKQAPIPVNIAYEIRGDSTIVSMVQQGLGATIMPRLAALPVPDGIQVCDLPAHLERVIGVAVLKQSLLSPCVFAFLDALLQGGRFSKLAVV